MLNPAQIGEYNDVGGIVVADVLTAEEVAELRQACDSLVAGARGVTTHNEIYDLEDSHTPEDPRVRRITTPHKHHVAFENLVHHKRIIEVLKDLWKTGVRFDTSKLNMKAPGYGAAVEWHQDWAFYPHTNDDLAAVGVMMDDMRIENGPLMIVPGSHRGPVFDHHYEGRFFGAIDPARDGVDLSRAIALTGSAGSITVHHVRTVHGSAPNTSNKPRRLLLLQFRAADAWPLMGFPDGIEAFDALLVEGEPIAPRMTACPVRIPLPPSAKGGSIYEMQKGLTRKFFADKAT